MGNVTKLIAAFIPERIKPTLRQSIFKFRNKGFKPYVKKNQTVEGVIFDFWIGDSAGQKWYEPQWVQHEMRFIRDYLLQPGDVVLECGAHHGCKTVVFSHWVGDEGKVIAFEPVPRNADIIQKNIEINNLQNVVLERKAVGSKEGKIVMTDESNAQVLNRKGSGLEVNITYLDKYVHLNPAFLKIDVEGFEIEVLKGAQNILKKKPTLMVEIHPNALKKRYNASVEDLFNLIDIEKYKLWVQWQGGDEPKVYDGKAPITEPVRLFALPKQ